MKAEALEIIIATDKRGLLSALALLSTIGLYTNFITVSSFLGGIFLFSIYSSINSVFLGRIFFQDENTNFRVALGLLLLFTFLATANGLAMFIVALEIFPVFFTMEIVIAILFITATVISLTRHIQLRNAPSA